MRSNLSEPSYQQGHAEEEHPQPNGADTDNAHPAVEVEKRNSLTRSSAARSNSKGSGFARRASGLQRQGLVGQRDSMVSNASSGVGGVVSEYMAEPQEEQRRGVELVDRPMDD